MKKFVILLLLLLGATSAFAESTEGIMNDTWNRTTHAMTMPCGTSIVADTLTIDAGLSANAVQLSADSNVVSQVILIRKSGGRNNVYISDSKVKAEASRGFLMTGDRVIAIPVDNVQDIWMKADTEGNGVNWVGVIQ